MDLYIDISKSTLNTAKLVKKQVQVRGKNGKIFSRMQWVDPNDNTPILEHSHGGEHDEHDHRIHSLSTDQKINVARAYIASNPSRANKFSAHTGIPYHRKGTVVGTLHHIADHLDKIPHEHIKDHLDTYSGDDKKETGKPAPLSVKNILGKDYNEDASNEEIKYASGEYGPLDREILEDTSNPMVSVDWIREKMEESKKLMEKHPISKGKNIDPYKALSDTFGSLSWQALAHTFSIPDLNITSNIAGISVYMERDGHVWVDTSFTLHNDEGNRVAEISRMIRRDEKGNLVVKNDYFEVNGRAQDNKMAHHIYQRSEQLWRHMSGGNPITIKVYANITVGTYAWSRKGFDFADEGQVESARNDLKWFCEGNDVDIDKLLETNGYKSLDDLQHPWQYAVLDDGNDWNMQDYDVKYTGNEDARKEAKGIANFGKAFMLAGKNAWAGIRVLNNDSLEESIYDPLKEYRR